MFELCVDADIILKELELGSAEALFDLIDDNRANLRPWLSFVDATNIVEDTVFYIQSVTGQDIYNGRFVTEIRYKDELAGLIDLHGGDKINKKVEIGYWLGEKFQGKGIMTRSCRALVCYAINELGMNRVVIKCAAGNIKSQAVPRRLNFKYEGIEREAQYLYGEFVDVHVFSMLRKDWNWNG